MFISSEFLSELFNENTLTQDKEFSVEGVTTDTRMEMRDRLFIPLEGESFDAHDFLQSAIEKGATAALWKKTKPVPDSVKEGFPLFFVENTLEGLQYLAKKYLKKVNPTVIGVTGSNGKTTTKDLIGSVTSSEYKTHRTAGNYNNHIGLPLTILSMLPDTEILVLEMGMSKAGEIELLSKLAEPDIGVITNIGESHIEYLGSREGIANAKAEMLAGMDHNAVLVFDGDEPLLSKYKQRENAISCGFSKGNDLLISNTEMHPSFTTFTVNGKIGFKLGMFGRHNVKNACFAISVGRELHIPEEKIKQALENVQLTGMRFEMLGGKNGATIINDAYNASPTSMKASIEVVREMSSYRNKVLVLGDIFELGQDTKQLHKTVADAITPDIDALFTVGEDAGEITKEVLTRFENINAAHFKDISELSNQLQAYLKPESVILLKASRGMKLERILDDLQ